MTASERPFAGWRKSTRSADNGACVEVATVADEVGLRDSKDPCGTLLIFDGAVWRAFLRDVKGGTFDHA